MTSKKKIPRTPPGEAAQPNLYDPQLRWSMIRSRWAYVMRESVSTHIIRPLEDHLFKRWLKQGLLSEWIEEMGLPYRSVESYMDNTLDLRVDPQDLIRSLSIKASFPDKGSRNRALSQFIWKGDWDLTYFDFRTGYRYRFISDIWQHRFDLVRSEAYRQFLEELEQGKPFRSHQKGILLNTPEKILEYLRIYVNYMEDMAGSGFDSTLGKDRLGVAIDRNGNIVKLNRGLHRLAMARVLGLDEIVVRVRAVHGQWWQQVTQGERGERALERLAQTLPTCRPAA